MRALECRVGAATAISQRGSIAGRMCINQKSIRVARTKQESSGSRLARRGTERRVISTTRPHVPLIFNLCRNENPSFLVYRVYFCRRIDPDNRDYAYAVNMRLFQLIKSTIIHFFEALLTYGCWFFFILRKNNYIRAKSRDHLKGSYLGTTIKRFLRKKKYIKGKTFKHIFYHKFSDI